MRNPLQITARELSEATGAGVGAVTSEFAWGAESTPGCAAVDFTQLATAPDRHTRKRKSNSTNRNPLTWRNSDANSKDVSFIPQYRQFSFTSTSNDMCPGFTVCLRLQWHAFGYL